MSLTKPDEPLKFDVHLSNFQAKGLPPDRYYALKVTFMKKIFWTVPIKNSEPKFLIDSTFYIEIEFDKLKSTYMNIELFSISSSNHNPEKELHTKSILPISVLRVDLLTIAIGTKHHDIHLLSSINGKSLGRIQFDVICEQIENISFTINSLNVKLNYCIQNQISFRLKYLYERNINETMFTVPIQSQHNTKDSTTIYSWTPDPKTNPLKFNKVMLSINELQCSNLEIVLYETNFSVEPTDIGEISTTNRKIEADVRSEDTFFKKIPKNTTIEKYEYGSRTLVAKKQIIENIDLILLPNFNEIGYSRLNLYNMLAQKDFLMQEQTSQCFHRLSYLYRGDIQRKSMDYEMNKSSNLSAHNFEKNRSHQHHRTNSASQIGGKATKENLNGQEDNINKEKTIECSAKPNNKKLSKNIVIKLIDEKTSIQFKQDICHNGKEIGKIEGVITLEHLPLLKQIMCGVHTEKGLDLNTNYYYTNLSSIQTELPKELQFISNQTLNLTQSILNFTLKQNTFSYRELNEQLTKTLVKFIEPLKYKDSEGHLKYEIKTEFDHIRAPQILLNLGLTIINSLDSFNTEQRIICFEILDLINNRSELSLKSLSLFTYFDANNEKNTLKQKVIESFIEFMIHTLDNTLEKLSKKFNDEQTRSFISHFLAVAYFRLPIFRTEFLKALNPEYDEDQKTEQIKNYNYVFDWGELFYNRVAKIKEINFQDKSEELLKILSKSNWRERIKLKGQGFYSIISHFEKYLYSKYEKTQEVNLDSVPGINEIKNSIIAELKTKPVSQYPQSLLKLFSIFIYNPNDMNRFYKIIIEHTNAYDSPCVFMAIKILDSFFQVYEQNKNTSSFSYKFDYDLLKNPFNIVFEIDNALCIAKYLWLYYKHAHIMSIIHINEILTDIFKNKFFNLFFHWSWQVRDIFYHLLWYIVSHRIKNKNYLKEKKNLFEERMNTLKRGDEQGFYKAFHNDYYEQMKSSILKEYYEKVRIIEVVRSVVRKEKLDPYYNTNFVSDSKILEKIGDSSRKMVVVSIYQYDLVEKEFKAWEKKNKNCSTVQYPEIKMLPPKDDYTEYTSSSVDQW